MAFLAMPVRATHADAAAIGVQSGRTSAPVSPQAVQTRLSGSGGAQHRRWHRDEPDAPGHAATPARALHEYVELVTGRDAIKMLRERGNL